MSQGVMFVEILPSTRGIGKAVEKDTTAAFKGAEKTGQGFFNRVGTWAKRSAVAVGAMVGVIGGLAIKGGISRALNIEDAQAKLKGLGHDTKSVEAIMESALASVKGTAFGLDTAATVASTAVAAGIKPGQELEKYLRLTADAATIAGVSMEEMGAILNKTTTAGKVYTQELNQLADRGLPIFQWLQEEYGVTAEELRKMVAAGEVDSATFRKVIEENIGGAALASGDTTRGAFRNMMAALSRLGVAFLGDGLGAAKTFFQEVTVIFDGLTDRIGPWVEKIQSKLSGMFSLEGFGDRALGGLDRMIDSFASGPIPQLLSALQPILPALAEMARLVGSALGDAFMKLGDALAPVLPMIAESLADAVVQLAPALTDLIVALLPIIPPLVEMAAAVIPIATAITGFLMPAIEWLIELLAGLITAESSVKGVLSGGMGFDSFYEKVSAIGGPLGVFIDTLQTVGSFIGEFAAYVIFGLQQARDAVVSGLTSIGEFFRSTWQTIGLVLGGALKVIVGLVTGNMALVKDGVQQGLNAIRNWWNNTWSQVAGTLSGVWGRITSSVSSGVNRVVGFMQALPGRILGAVSSLPGLLAGVGAQMIQGLINGVRGMIGNAVAAVQEVGGAMLSSVKSFLGIKSPSRVFRDEVGKMVGLGLLEGISDRDIRGRIDSSVDHMVSIPDVDPTFAGAGPLVGSMEFHGTDGSGVLRDLMFALRTTARGGVYAR